MKNCNTCGTETPLDGFYKGMAKCKECHKATVHARYTENMKDPIWRERELDRQREKADRHRSEGRKPSKDATKRGGTLWQQRNRVKRSAHLKVQSAVICKKMFKQPCEVCGELKVDAHHDDYERPLDVRWLCRKHHMEHHREMNRLERFTRDKLNNQP